MKRPATISVNGKQAPVLWTKEEILEAITGPRTSCIVSMGPAHQEYGQMWAITILGDKTPQGMEVDIALVCRETVLQLEEAGHLSYLRGNYHPVRSACALPASPRIQA